MGGFAAYFFILNEKTLATAELEVHISKYSLKTELEEKRKAHVNIAELQKAVQALGQLVSVN